jgi:tetratricopeptide (TPR) repeat protein
MEPQRAVLRSYLGKAYGVGGDPARADHELDLAKGLDSEDPTPWLYGAMLDREQNRINESVRELEHSIKLNDNRAIYRSRMLLDEDQAVRSSSLATIYQRAGMNEVAVREAARAVSYDYANHSAHQFLAESFNALRDPTRFNLRYETVWFNELLLANMLSPVGAAPLSQDVSQQEYSRLFERNRIGLNADSLHRSDGHYRSVISQFLVSRLGLPTQ